MLVTILLVVLILMLLGAIPNRATFGDGPVGGLGLIILILIILLLSGRI